VSRQFRKRKVSPKACQQVTRWARSVKDAASARFRFVATIQVGRCGRCQHQGSAAG
jgi:hypothetical protein